MEIKYTYLEPEDRPIKKAEFKTAYGDVVKVEVEAGTGISISVAYQMRIDLNSIDLKDFCGIINQINRQINGNEEEIPDCGECIYEYAGRSDMPCRRCIALTSFKGELRDRNYFHRKESCTCSNGPK